VEISDSNRAGGERGATSSRQLISECRPPDIVAADGGSLPHRHRDALAVLVAASGHANTTWLKTALSPLQFQFADEIAFSKRRALGAPSSAACISIAASNRHGPQLVIANIIENTFGGEEAARYAIALATGKAQ
jgi:hypothetical protein